jgi:hypothetical protein
MRNIEFPPNSSVVQSRVYIFPAFFCDALGGGVLYNNRPNFGILGPNRHETELI